MQYIMVNPMTGSVELLDKDSFVVIAPDDLDLDEMEDDLFRDAHNDPRLKVFPLVTKLDS